MLPLERRRGRIFTPAIISLTVTTLLLAAMFVAVMWAGWQAMNKELCKREYPASDYEEMQLDCSQFE
jgi:hypothetical protein